ncbi:squalene/phytoene synthase family protein [Sphingomonas jatrophae]|uniref:Phytoene synthase n=1 Tax=Sphingomonas jatrophae TaxID=1166337 RepID=A0A1I6JJF7_9SPHN|nr:squalene/phytoene synthase family protein [Sphingomonas jatrophae]SFR79039.1 phytoene synthase [Sphingomonas jatrophae]
MQDPEIELALLHAPADARDDLAALFALDARMRQIVIGAREPMLAAIKLVWWRERIEALPEAPAGEPLLAALAEAVRAGMPAEAVAGIVAGWEDVLAEDVTAGHAARGAALFRAAAARLGGPMPDGLEAGGAAWALVDAARHGAETLSAAQGQSRAPRWPGRLRALGMLARLAEQDAAGGRPAPQATPGRSARMIWHRLTGR